MRFTDRWFSKGIASSVVQSIKVRYGPEDDVRIYAEFIHDGFECQSEVELDESMTDNVRNIMVSVSQQVDAMLRQLRGTSIPK